MKTFIYNLSTLLVVVSLLSQSWAHAAPQREPAQQTESTQESQSLWKKATGMWDRLMFGMLTMQAELTSPQLPQYDVNAPESEKLQVREKALKMFFDHYSQGKDLVKDTNTLIRLMTIFKDMAAWHQAESSKTAAFIAELEIAQNKEKTSAELVSLAKTQLNISADIISSIAKTLEADLVLLQKFKSAGIELSLPARDPQTGKFLIKSQQENMFLMFFQRTLNHNQLMADAQDGRDDILNNKNLFTHNPVIAAKTDAEILALFENFRSSLQQLVQRMAGHLKNPYMNKQLQQAFADSEQLFRHIDNRVSQIKASMRKANGTPITQRTDAQVQLGKLFDKNIQRYAQILNMYLRELRVAIQAQQKESEFQAKIRETLPKTFLEGARGMPEAVKADIKSIPQIPNALRRTAQRLWETWFGSKPTTAAPGTTTEDGRTVITEQDLTARHEGKNLWEVLRNTWLELQKKGYIDYSGKEIVDGKEVATFNRPVRVTLTTQDVQNLPQEIRAVDLADLDRIVRRAYDPGTSESTKNLILMLKDSSLTDSQQSRVSRATVREVESSNGGRTRLIELTATNGEKVLLDYTVDPEIAMKSSSPMALTPLHKNLSDSIGHAVKGFPLEAGPFYLGLLANTWLNFIQSYESDPMAFERFFHELTSIPGQIGFAGFMVGNHFGQTIFKELLKIKNDQDFVRRGMATRLFIQNFSMAMGSVFSNITHDLIALTAPCAKTLYQINFDDEINRDEALAPCQEAYAAVINSDKIHQYIQMSLTVMAASLGAAAVQGLAAGAVKFGTKRSTTLKGFAVMFEGVWKSKPMQYRIAPGLVAKYAQAVYSDTKKAQMLIARTPTPAGLIMTAAHLVLFFQADARANPYIHKFEETLLNSGKELNDTRNGLVRAHNELVKSDFALKCDRANNYENYANKLQAHKYSARDVFYTAQNKAFDDSCRELPEQLKEYKERNMMWRDTLMYKFNMGYYSWQQFFSEFMTQYLVVKKFYGDLLHYAYNDPTTDDNLKPYVNPLFQDDPLYGVIPHIQAEPTEQMLSPDSEEELPGVTSAIRIQNDPNEGERFFIEQENGEGPHFIKKVELENAKLARLELAAQLIDNHIAEINKFTSATVKMGNIETTRPIGNRDGVNAYIKRLETIKSKFLGFNYETRDFTGIIEGINLLNQTYDSYKRFYIKEIIGDGGSTRKMVLTTDHGHIRNSILNLRRFIGKPKPLKKGEAFLVRFDDWVKANYKDTLELLAKKGFNGKVSEAMLWNSFCGLDYNSDYVMRYERGHEQRGATLNLGFKIPLPWKDGTGLSFLSPKIIDPYFDYALINKQLGQICHTDRFYKGFTLGLLSGESIRTSFDVNRKVVVDIPNNMSSNKGTVLHSSPRYHYSDVPVVKGTDSKGRMIVGNADPVLVGSFHKRQYDNMLEFLVDNIDPRIFDTKRSGGNLDDWWNKHVSPKIDKAFESYEQSYFKLIDDQFSKALYSEDENGNPFSLEKLLSGKLERTFYKLPNSLALAYIDEVNVYLGMLQSTFRSTQNKKREMIKQKVAQLPYEQLKLVDEKGQNVLWQELKKTGSLANTLKTLVTRIETANTEAKVSEDARALAALAIQLDRDEAKFNNHLKSLKAGLGQMIYSLAGQIEKSKAGTKHEAQCIGIAQYFGPVMVHFEAVIKALDLYLPTEEGQDYATHPLHYLLNMQKYGYAEMDSSSTLFQSFLQASTAAVNADIDLKRKYGEEKGMACYAQVNLKGQYESFYRGNMTEDNLFNLNIQIPQSHLTSAYTQDFMVGLQAAMQANQVEEFYKQLKLDPTEKHKAEVAYVATTSLFETLGHVYNQVTVFKAATQRQDMSQSEMQEMQQKVQDEKKGHSGTTPFSGNR